MTDRSPAKRVPVTDASSGAATQGGGVRASPPEFPTLVAGAAIVDEAKRLFLMQSSGKFGNTWIVPGGKPSFGEPAAQAVVRETHEETGLVASNPRLLGVREWIDPARHFVCLEYLVEADSSAPVTLNEEAVAYRWCSVADLEKLEIAGLTRALIDERLIPEGHVA